MSTENRDRVRRALREFRKYEGDGSGGTGALPIGDPSSGAHNPPKSLLREALEPVALALDGVNAAQAATEGFRDEAEGFRDEAAASAATAGTTILTNVAFTPSGTGAATTTVDAVLRGQDYAGVVRTPAIQSVADLLADEVLGYSGTEITVVAGDIIRTRVEGFSYRVAASGATDQHVTTAGGVKLYTQRGVAGFNAQSFGNDDAAVQKAIDIIGTGGGTVLLDAPMSWGAAIQINNQSMAVTGDGLGSRVLATTAAPMMQSLIDTRTGMAHLGDVKISDVWLDGNNLATFGLDLERFSRACALTGNEIRRVNGDGMRVLDGWSFGVIGGRSGENAGNGALLGNSDISGFGEVNVPLVANFSAYSNGGTGLTLKYGHGGAIIASTFENNNLANLTAEGEARFIGGNYLEAHLWTGATAETPRTEYSMEVGSADGPLVSSSVVANWIHGGHNGALGRNGDGVKLRDVHHTDFRNSFGAVRHEYAFDETWNLTGCHFDMTGIAHTPGSIAQVIYNLTTETGGDVSVLKGDNCFNNSSRLFSIFGGIRETDQIKPNGVSGSLRDWRIAWDGAERWRFGKLSSSSPAFSWQYEGNEQILFDVGNVRLKGAASATSASAANVFVDSTTGQLRRSTSSMQYKTNVEPIDLSYSHRLLDAIEPIYYASLCAGDNPDWRWWGLSAEQVGSIDPRLVSWRTSEMVQEGFETIELSPAKYDEYGALVREAVVDQQPIYKEVPLDAPVAEGVHYTAIVPHLLMICKDFKKQNAARAKQITALMDRVEALEAQMGNRQTSGPHSS
jgi:hypothetical protein